jgi:hypothetical protein
MVYEKVITQQSLTNVLEKIEKRKSGKKKKSLAKHFGCLKRGIDGLEYQRVVRSEWN